LWDNPATANLLAHFALPHLIFCSAAFRPDAADPTHAILLGECRRASVPYTEPARASDVHWPSAKRRSSVADLCHCERCERL